MLLFIADTSLQRTPFPRTNGVRYREVPLYMVMAFRATHQLLVLVWIFSDYILLSYKIQYVVESEGCKVKPVSSRHLLGQILSRPLETGVRSIEVCLFWLNMTQMSLKYTLFIYILLVPRTYVASYTKDIYSVIPRTV